MRDAGSTTPTDGGDGPMATNNSKAAEKQRREAEAKYTAAGAETYTERRLLDIAEAVDSLQKMVRVFLIIMLVGLAFGLLALGAR